MDEKIEVATPEMDHSPTPAPVEETYHEKPASFLQREMKIFRTFLARAGMTLMYLTGMLIIGPTT